MNTTEQPNYSETLIDELFGENIPVEKVGFFSKFGRFFRRLFGMEKGPIEAADQEAYSKFKHFYEEVERDDPKYLPMRQAATLCDDALRCVSQRIKTSSRLNTIETNLIELGAFMDLAEEEIDDLKRQLDRFVALAGERSVLLEKLADYDSSLVSMEPLENDARQAMTSIKDAEKHQRALRQDIGYLTGEKQELAFDRQDMNNTLKMIYQITIGVVSVFAVISIALLYMFFNTAASLFIPTTIFVLLVMGFVLLINIFRYRVTRELKQNTKKQQRAVELLNKKSVVYAYYTNFLRYCYKKYKANNSRTLETNLNDLENYRHLANRIDTVRSLMYETETSIERFVRDKKLGGMKGTIQGFARTINLEDKKRRFNDFTTEKTSVEKSLKELDRRHEEIWDSLNKLSKLEPKTSAIIDSYIREAEKLFEAHEKKNEETDNEERPIWQLFDMVEDGDEENTA